MSKVPSRSSGAAWTEGEDERLYLAVIDLAAQFPGRSLAAVLTRIERHRAAWWGRRRVERCCTPGFDRSPECDGCPGLRRKRQNAKNDGQMGARTA
jgi:hypothetical protein